MIDLIVRAPFIDPLAGCSSYFPSHSGWEINTTLSPHLLESIKLFKRAPDHSPPQMSIRYTPSGRVSAPARSSSGWLASVWVLAQSPSSSKSVAQWSLSSWTACSPRRPLLWHPSRSSWPPGTAPPCSRGGRGFSHRRSKTGWGSGGSQGEGETSLDQAAPVASFSSETFVKTTEYKTTGQK